jgi:hypothetical protein
MPLYLKDSVPFEEMPFYLKVRMPFQGMLVSISSTFYEQLLHQKPFCQKITNPNCKHIKGVERTLV